MALVGETIASGAPSVCSDCGTHLKLEVLQSGAGHYIGTRCACGPYSRESGYFASRELAQGALVTGAFGRPPTYMGV
jgi:hypothetical protein